MKKPRPAAETALELVRAHGAARALEILEELRPTSNLNIRCSPARLTTYRAAAKAARETLTAWILRALDAAAERCK